MKSIRAIGLIATAMLAANSGGAEVFTIGGFTFDEANSAKTAAIVSGPRNLKVQNSPFGKYSSSYLRDASVRSNAFANFNRSASVGWLLQSYRVSRPKDLTAKSVALSGGEDGQRSVIEMRWGNNGIRNLPGTDLVIFESENSGGFAVSVLKSGASGFSRAKYQFADTYDATHEVNAYAFDLKDFDIGEGEMIAAIRIQNIVAAPNLAHADKVDTVSGQGTIIFASDTGYKQGFPLLKKSNVSKSQPESTTANILYVAALHDIEPFENTLKPIPAGMLRVGGFILRPSNSVKTVVIVEGPANLKDQSSRLFDSGSNQSESVSATGGTNQFANLDPGKSLGRMLRPKNSKNPSHLMFPDVDYSPPSPNIHRCAIELTWNGDELRNKPGYDFVIFEVAEWEGFAVAVQKSGSNQWTPYRYQFTNSFESARQINTIAFDLSKFGLKENETITGIRIRNLFNANAAAGADRVDSATGEGTVIYPNDSKYKSSFPLLMKPGGKEFTTDLLDADIVYVIGLHDIESPGKVATRK
jgi:hypothetical protein